MAMEKTALEAAEPTPLAKVKEFMSTCLEVIHPSESVENAAGRMRAFDIGCLLVGDARAMVGLITDRDIVLRVTALGKNGRTTPVFEAMSPGIICCSEDCEIGDLARLMELNQVYRMTLFDQKGQPAGLVTLGDLARNGYETLAAQILIANSKSVELMSETPCPVD
jgi:CBS domain-containing protein